MKTPWNPHAPQLHSVHSQEYPILGKVTHRVPTDGDDADPDDEVIDDDDDDELDDDMADTDGEEFGDDVMG